jgi:hypothetical protein
MTLLETCLGPFSLHPLTHGNLALNQCHGAGRHCPAKPLWPVQFKKTGFTGETGGERFAADLLLRHTPSSVFVRFPNGLGPL